MTPIWTVLRCRGWLNFHPPRVPKFSKDQGGEEADIHFRLQKGWADHVQLSLWCHFSPMTNHYWPSKTIYPSIIHHYPLFIDQSSTIVKHSWPLPLYTMISCSINMVTIWIYPLGGCHRGAAGHRGHLFLVWMLQVAPCRALESNRWCCFDGCWYSL